MNILLLAGDGIGPEVMLEAEKIMTALGADIASGSTPCGGLSIDRALVGGAALEATGHPLPPETLAKAKAADAILFGAVGDPRFDSLERHLRPEQAILGLRSELGLFANLRPARMFPGLENASTLRAEIANAIDLLIVRELGGDVYFGDKGRRTNSAGEREGYDLMSYCESEVRRIAHVAFRAAQRRKRQLCSVDKANVLETSQLWRDVVTQVAAEYPDVALSHLYVDNAAMQLVRDPGQFDVIVTGNLFGDILSDQASVCVGSIGLLASASLASAPQESASGARTKGLYEPIHGSAPDIAGKNLANPIAIILSLAMLLRHSGGDEASAARIEAAVTKTISDGCRSVDLGGSMTTRQLGDVVAAEILKQGCAQRSST